ncbi:MAG: hypothetical protein GY866_41625 [Proteobacteria bacterium]|nr:hypothetical protein [Pseudomonadota bacterium]
MRACGVAAINVLIVMAAPKDEPFANVGGKWNMTIQPREGAPHALAGFSLNPAGVAAWKPWLFGHPDANAPLLLSALARAGANRRLKGIADENGDAGLLYSIEIPGLNLQGAELDSLSARDKGKGVIDYSGGGCGLVRAFRTAGARWY